MNNKDFIAALSARTGLTAARTSKLTAALARTIADRLDDETALTVQGFGTFEVRKKQERIMVSPTTGKRRLIPPKLVLTFRPGSGLKDKLK